MADIRNTYRGTRSNVYAAHAPRPSVSQSGVKAYSSVGEGGAGAFASAVRARAASAGAGVAGSGQGAVADAKAQAKISPSASKNVSPARRIGRIVLDAFLVVVAVCALILAASSIYMVATGGQSSIFGYSIEVVASGSMSPTIATGDLIVVKEQKSYSVGDIVTYRDSSGNLVTHRITEVNSQGQFTTKGDANNVADRALVSPSSIVGSLVLIVPGGEVLVNFARQPLIIGALVFVLVLLLFLPAVGRRHEPRVKEAKK